MIKVYGMSPCILYYNSSQHLQVTSSIAFWSVSVLVTWGNWWFPLFTETVSLWQFYFFLVTCKLNCVSLVNSKPVQRCVNWEHHFFAVVSQFPKAHCFAVCLLAHAAKYLTQRWILGTPWTLNSSRTPDHPGASSMALVYRWTVLVLLVLSSRYTVPWWWALMVGCWLLEPRMFGRSWCRDTVRYIIQWLYS